MSQCNGIQNWEEVWFESHPECNPDDCGPGSPCIVAGMQCDCTCQCKNPLNYNETSEGSNWHHVTECGGEYFCRVNYDLICEQNCSDIDGGDPDYPYNTFCTVSDMFGSCGIILGCMDDNANNYNPQANFPCNASNNNIGTGDGQCCTFGTDDSYDVPNINNKWIFRASEFQVVNNTISNFVDNECQPFNCPQISGYPKIADRSKLYYINVISSLYDGNGTGVSTHPGDIIFAFIDTELRGVSYVNDLIYLDSLNPYDAYVFLEVKYKEGNQSTSNYAEINEIGEDITFYYYHNEGYIFNIEYLESPDGIQYHSGIDITN